MVFQPLGASALGVNPLAGDPLHDLPLVTVTTIGAVTTGGPNMTVAWVYSQPQGDPQSKYRLEILDDALATTHYDSGWLSGTDLEHTFDVDAEGVPHESTDVTARVSVESPSFRRADDVDAYTIVWGVPHAAIDSPADLEVWTDLTGVDVAWTFTDDVGGKTQLEYRVRLILTGPNLTIWDSGWVVSGDTTYNIPVILNPGSNYTVELQLKNNHGIRSD